MGEGGGGEVRGMEEREGKGKREGEERKEEKRWGEERKEKKRRKKKREKPFVVELGQKQGKLSLVFSKNGQFSWI